MNVLFICSRNQWRSPTAEHHWRNHPQWSVRSAGTSRNAKRRVTPALLQWADVIFVMEQKHKNRLKAEFTRLLDHKPLHILEIPDDYHYGDPALIALLDDLVPPYLSGD
ncbi:low molecular weight protein tyrosine phosphatase family protein [Morganella morganii]|uniref:low molecular weight protein tyrosine phosphatase family protein n=1 Tax=Morganella morganii TaxID=582 RepID=UPI0014197416|nr:phosphotyrosine protein phosphatase [Morganella morganii]NIH17585.1 phosphotyrosine protein phosphatase [Morganella morganii]